MNNYLKKICLFLLCLVNQMGYSQDQGAYIEIAVKNDKTLFIENYSSFSFKGSDGNRYKGKICIYNDSQFSFYNYFNELEKDTFKISFVDYVNIIGKPERYKIRPVLLVLGILAYPLWPVTIPIFVYRRIATKRHNRWVGAEEFTIKIHYPNPEP